MTEVDYCREMYQVVGLSRLALVLQPEVREGAQGGQAGCEKESSCWLGEGKDSGDLAAKNMA